MHELTIYKEVAENEYTFNVKFEIVPNGSATDENDTFEYIDVLDDDGALAYMSEKQLITTIKERT